MLCSPAARRIKAAFLELLEDNPDGPITVTQIAQRAHVNRVTFYRLYGTLEDVLADILDGFTEENNELIERIDESADPYGDEIRAVLEHYRRNMPALRTILNSSMRDVFARNVEDGARNPFEELFGKPSSGTRSMLVSFYAAGISRVICDWIQGGCKEGVDEVLGFLERALASLVP